MVISPLKKAELPSSPSFLKLLGPSFIILGLGLGSGEVILWPYLTSKYGMGIIWGAILGLTFQFFMNMEIERYALVNGESVFVGLARKLKWLPYWFLLSTFLPWIWPGIASASAKFFGHIFGISETKYLAIAFLILMGLILSFGPVLYKTVENFQKILIGIGVPSIFILSIILARSNHFIDLAKGVIGIGNGYNFLPEGISIASFLAALAYAGAGGNLNLAQSFYIKEKGYGMGKYAGKITSLLTGKSKEDVSLTGTTFEVTNENITKFKQWWKNINIEHFLVFFLTGSVTILLLGLLSYVTTYGVSTNLKDIDFVFFEAKEIGVRVFPFMGIFFLLVAGATLFGTQLTVFDATSRILTENIILSFRQPAGSDSNNISKIYYSVLWVQIICGILIFLFGFSQPLQLLTLAAVLNAFAMFVHVGLTLWLNLTSLAKPLKPSYFRIFFMIFAFLFYGSFSLFVIYEKFFL